MLPTLLALTLALPLACTDKSTDDTGGDGGALDGGGDDTGALGCVPTAAGELPPSLVEYAWDDGSPAATVLGQGWSIAGYAIDEEPLHEWVRFEPQVDVTVHAITVALANLPADPDAPVTIGLYDDFGFNGFDAWHPAPLWQGSLCAGDLVEGELATFVLDTPVTVPAGSLVYAGHLRQGPDDVALAFDGSYAGDGTCALWDDCHSAWNLPELTDFTSGGYSYSFWKGYSGPFPYDYVVRLHVAEEDEPAVEDAVFVLDPAVPTGSRQAWGDYDADGYEDLWLGSRLYRNLGNGTYEDTTDTSGITALGIAGSGGVWGDYDNDGCLDLFVFAESYSSGDTLLHSECDGTFTDATATAGIEDALDGSDACAATHASTAAAAWWDMDADGLLDLYLSNFICWSAYTYYQDRAWRNQGDGTFVALGSEQGFTSSSLAGRGANPIDADRDGDVDLLVNNYVLHRNLHYDNDGDGTVSEVGATSGLTGEKTFSYGTWYYGHTIGTAWGDLDNDGDFDVIQANLAHPRYFDFSAKTQVFLAQGDGTYVDNAGDWEDPTPDNGLRYQETHSVPTLGDFDADGVLDLAITAVYDGRPTDFYWGVGDGSFVGAWAEAGIATENGWGMSAGDYDNDGLLDLATSGGFYANQRPGGHWVQVRAVGDVGSNRAAIGAVVAVRDDRGQERLRHVPGGNGQGEQDSLFLHFGLGEADTVERITVDYIGGDSVTLEGPFEADQRIWVSESGQVHQGWDPPSWYGPVHAE